MAETRDELAAELEKLLAAATPGPWEARSWKYNGWHGITLASGADDTFIAENKSELPWAAEYAGEIEANFTLIAWCRNNAAAILARLREGA